MAVWGCCFYFVFTTSVYLDLLSPKGVQINTSMQLHDFSLFSDTARLPPAPRKLRARAISAHVIKLRWRDPGRSKGRATRFYSVRYSVLGQEDNGKFVQSHDSRARVGKLHPNTSYTFAVRAVAGKKGSPWSKAVIAVTAAVGTFRGGNCRVCGGGWVAGRWCLCACVCGGDGGGGGSVCVCVNCVLVVVVVVVCVCVCVCGLCDGGGGAGCACV